MNQRSTRTKRRRAAQRICALAAIAGACAILPVDPAAADFRSIVLVNLFAKHIRRTQAAGHAEFTVTEMLPDLGQLWLTDRESRRYSSELRIIAYDNMTERSGSGNAQRNRGDAPPETRCHCREGGERWSS